LEVQGKIAFITERNHFHAVINPKYRDYFEDIVDTYNGSVVSRLDDVASDDIDITNQEEIIVPVPEQEEISVEDKNTT
jgi:hypothetical protein